MTLLDPLVARDAPMVFVDDTRAAYEQRMEGMSLRARAAHLHLVAVASFFAASFCLYVWGLFDVETEWGNVALLAGTVVGAVVGGLTIDCMGWATGCMGSSSLLIIGSVFCAAHVYTDEDPLGTVGLIIGGVGVGGMYPMAATLSLARERGGQALPRVGTVFLMQWVAVCVAVAAESVARQCRLDAQQLLSVLSLLVPLLPIGLARQAHHRFSQLERLEELAHANGPVEAAVCVERAANSISAAGLQRVGRSTKSCCGVLPTGPAPSWHLANTPISTLSPPQASTAALGRRTAQQLRRLLDASNLAALAAAALPWLAFDSVFYGQNAYETLVFANVGLLFPSSNGASSFLGLAYALFTLPGYALGNLAIRCLDPRRLGAAQAASCLALALCYATTLAVRLIAPDVGGAPHPDGPPPVGPSGGGLHTAEGGDGGDKPPRVGATIVALDLLVFTLLNAGPNTSTFVITAHSAPGVAPATFAGLAAAAGKLGAALGVAVLRRFGRPANDAVALAAFACAAAVSSTLVRPPLIQSERQLVHALFNPAEIGASALDRLRESEFHIPRERLVLHAPLGAGAQGRVHAASYDGHTVAVKEVQGTPSSTDREARASGRRWRQF